MKKLISALLIASLAFGVASAFAQPHHPSASLGQANPNPLTSNKKAAESPLASHKA